MRISQARDAYLNTKEKTVRSSEDELSNIFAPQNAKYEYDGAWLSQIDMTTNISLGNRKNSLLFMHWLNLQKPFIRLAHDPFRDSDGNICSIHYSKNLKPNSNKYILPIVYLKGPELKERKLKAIQKKLKEISGKFISSSLDKLDENSAGQIVIDTKSSTEVLYLEQKKLERQLEYLQDKLIPYCEDNGVCRIEIKFKSKYLQEKKIKSLHEMLNGGIEILENECKKRVNMLVREVKQFDYGNIPSCALISLSEWEHGVPFSRSWRTVLRHRQMILDAGFQYDIKIPRDNAELEKPREYVQIVPKALEKPDWYNMPNPNEEYELNIINI
jgi:hypothetical protein